MLAPGAGEVLRQLLPLVDIPADPAAPAGFFAGTRLGLDVAVVVVVGQGPLLGEDLRVDGVRDKQRVGLEIQGVQDLPGDKGVGIGGQMQQAGGVPFGLVEIGAELVRFPPAAHAEMLEKGKGRVVCENRRGKKAGAPDHLMGQCLFADRHGDAVGLVGDLGERIDDAGVVSAVLPRRQQKQTVADVHQSLFVHGFSSFP